MAAPQTFRTAFNGFNREDVVRYIEHLNAQHTAQVNQLNSELEFLRGKLPEASPEVAGAVPPAPTAGQDELVAQQAGRIRELFDRCNQLEESLAAAQADYLQSQTRADGLSAELNAANEQLRAFQSRMDLELEAYRRAERTERMARQRAEQLYCEANGALGDATAKVDEAANQIGLLSDRVVAQLTELQNAVSGSKQALRDAAATMYTIRPTADPEA